MIEAEIRCASEADTARAARTLAEQAEPGTVFLLEGDLGSGKTSFSRAFIRTLTGDPGLDVPSPTFTLVQTYDSPRGRIYHFDLYRLKDPEEIFELGWEDALTDGLVLVEWPGRLGPFRPGKAKILRFSFCPGNPDARTITVESGT